jgi:hypothetical protein
VTVRRATSNRPGEPILPGRRTRRAGDTRDTRPPAHRLASRPRRTPVFV